MLHGQHAHAEAVSRISWCVAERAIGVVTGECGSGKTVAARVTVAGLDASRHTTIYLGTPGVGLRGMYAGIAAALGGTPRFHCASLIPAATGAGWPAPRPGAATTTRRSPRASLATKRCAP